MCDDHGPSRRSFLHGAAVLGLAAAVPAAYRKPLARLPLHSPARLASWNGENAYSMAMHIHGPFSEQYGSMDSQLYQATVNGVDVLWWTDHAERMAAWDYRQAVHFTGQKEKGAAGQGGWWTWDQKQGGAALTPSSGGQFVTSPVSPDDPGGGSMFLQAQAAGSGHGWTGYLADSRAAGFNDRGSLGGQTLTVAVLLTTGWKRGYLELRIGSSYHEASAGRAAGKYTLSYRFVPPGVPASRKAQGNLGVVTIPVTPDPTAGWTTQAVTPEQDIAALWPDQQPGDFALYELTLAAGSSGDLAGGWFGYLRFGRTATAGDLFSQQAAMMAASGTAYPSVTQQQGLELSGFLPHCNWFGPNVAVPDYSSVTAGNYLQWLEGVVQQAQAGGGLVSFNHPFGYSAGPALPQSQQDALLAQVAANLLPGAALGATILEVGYELRSGADLAHHVALWDIFSRNAVFLTGNGTSDDHYGLDWETGAHTGGNNWVTNAWAPSTGQADLLAALRAGRAWNGSLSGFRGSLDLLADGSCPMGSVSVSSLTTRQLAASATGIPAGGSLVILQGAVDYAGTSALASDVQVIGSFPDTAVAAGGGQVTVPVDTTGESFVRSQVLDGNGNVVGLSNPAWLLKQAPPNGIPAARAA